MAPSLPDPRAMPVAHYVVAPHRELNGCFEIARLSKHRSTQYIGNYTDYGTATEVALFLNRQVSWEAP